MLGHKHIPSREGGVEIVVEQLAVRMVEKGHKVTVYNRSSHHVSGHEYDIKDMKEYKGVRIRKSLTLDMKGLAAFTSAISAGIAAAFGKYDIVHFHAEGPCIACFIPKLTGKRVIATIHGLDHKRDKWGRIASAIILAGERGAVKHADEIIVLSEGVKKYFADTYGRETRLIPNGVERPVRLEASLIKERYGLNEGDYILFLGRLVPEKGVHLLIEAYNKLHTDKKLVIAGGVSDSSEYAERLKKDAEGNDNIIFTGFVYGETLEELYSNAYVYVLPSLLEGMPLSLLEAMSYGNCCLTSDIEECTDVTKDCGVSFRSEDADDLKSKLEELLADKPRVDHLRESSADYICERFDWDSVTDKTLELYMEGLISRISNRKPFR
ncbi:MAG: glycosyltransferase family 4 protein [Lachnospiraceae bacterium]|nr:glycosyltransferase family 4 protein [Lachnospiraceae bacterium]